MYQLTKRRVSANETTRIS